MPLESYYCHVIIVSDIGIDERIDEGHITYKKCKKI